MTTVVPPSAGSSVGVSGCPGSGGGGGAISACSQYAPGGQAGGGALLAVAVDAAEGGFFSAAAGCASVGALRPSKARALAAPNEVIVRFIPSQA